MSGPARGLAGIRILSEVWEYPSRGRHNAMPAAGGEEPVLKSPRNDVRCAVGELAHRVGQPASRSVTGRSRGSGAGGRSRDLVLGRSRELVIGAA